MSSPIDEHRRDLTGILNAVYEDIEKSRAQPRRMHPPRLVSFLWHRVTGRKPVPEQIDWKDQPSQAVRKIHDFYGWKAGPAVENKGACAGTLYRTAGYMAHSLNARSGKKGENKTVHLEHTVPVNTLMKALQFRANDFRGPIDLHNFLISHSVLAGLSFDEESHMKRTVDSRWNCAFERNGELSGSYPFLRYKPLREKRIGFQIFNVVTGEEINIETFTFADHRRTLQAASELCGIRSELGVYDGSLFNPDDWFVTSPVDDISDRDDRP